MGFASEYLSDRVLLQALITDRPARDTSLIIVIPAYNEPEILKTIDSLAACRKPDCGIELIVHVNAGPGSGEESLEVNRNTLKELESRKKDSKLPFRLFVIDTGESDLRGWGAGLARKVAMDEALRRFNAINCPDGLIVSLDADCEVEENYLCALHRDFFEDKTRSACSIYFEHPLDGIEYDKDLYLAITKYELHLRYYYQALSYCMFPEVYHTVGSAFAVRALTYLRSGGMNRQQAGEDFYFIQKILPMGGYFYLNTTTVFPSPRISDRVPFGTGPAIKSLVHSDNKILFTYNPEAFYSLKLLFESVDRLYDLDNSENPEKVIPGLSSLARDFLIKEQWQVKLNEIRTNTAGIGSFKKRFFSWFNMFKVVKYLNWAHSEGGITKVEVGEAANQMLKALGMDQVRGDLKDLLIHYRKLER